MGERGNNRGMESTVYVTREFVCDDGHSTFFASVPAGKPPLPRQRLAPRMPPVPSGTFVWKKEKPHSP